MIASVAALTTSLAWPIGLAALLGLVSGSVLPWRPGRPLLGPAGLLLVTVAAVVSSLGLVPGLDGLWLDIGVVLAATYAACCLAAALARRGVERVISARRRA